MDSTTVIVLPVPTTTNCIKFNISTSQKRLSDRYIWVRKYCIVKPTEKKIPLNLSLICSLRTISILAGSEVISEIYGLKTLTVNPYLAHDGHNFRYTEKWVCKMDCRYGRFLILLKYLIPQINHFVLNSKNIKSWTQIFFKL